ncbi:unnamed protein product [Larinioides sclopetarius]|uniref:tRNA wybutosine-synthesizing protein 4 n=1 Tax=Larinioides sclopetarius TaxID=280406 RepID=A0AAV1ZG49_9ARAC
MQVQNTNDSSIVSKLSAANKGYFQDNWLKMFVEKEQKRSPIINRGYYIRFKAIEAAFNSWFATISSLTSGKSQIDYPAVMRRKLEYIQNSEFSNLLDLQSTQDFSNKNIVAISEEYAMLGIDLQDCKELKQCFQDMEINFTAPTLFLSECSVTYMEPKGSNALIEWVQINFPNSAFVVYEQVDDDFGFSIVMKNHFKSLGCPLKSINPKMDAFAICSRFKEQGWPLCSTISMFDFYMNFPEEEKLRIQSIELFDEFEMWHEKCRHYVLTWACQGAISVPKILHSKSGSLIFDNMSAGTLNCTYELSSQLIHRFGHQVALLSSRFLIVSGGFGQLKKRHQRLEGLTCYDTVSKRSYLVPSSSIQDPLGKRMFHSMTKLTDGTLVVIGGRSSPATIFNTVVSIHCDDMSQECASYTAETVTHMPLPTWRHSQSLIHIDGVEHIFIFGGRTAANVVTNESFILNTKTWNFSEIPSLDIVPSPRHSHSAASLDKRKFYVTGGLSKDERILNSVYVFDVATFSWSELNISGLLPRYSHSSVCYNNAIYLVGGISGFSYGPHSVGMIDLCTNTAYEFELKIQAPEYPLILSNHCCYVYEDRLIVTGGGGNCFSFGTHFNEIDICIEFPEQACNGTVLKD